MFSRKHKKLIDELEEYRRTVTRAHNYARAAKVPHCQKAWVAVAQPDGFGARVGGDPGMLHGWQSRNPTVTRVCCHINE